jgi:arginine deiminase
MAIYSEINTLKRVIIHRPLESLRRLTPSNCHELLFDDVLWPEKAAAEHDYFAQVLRDNGVEVLLLGDLLQQTLTIKEAKAYLINQMVNLQYAGTKEGELLTQYLMHLEPAELTKLIFGGMTYADLGGFSLGLCSKTADANDFLFPPLPNHLFTRDSSFWIGEGVSINHMAYPARRGETANMSAIYKYHPSFEKQKPKIWFDGSKADKPMPSIEGGDVLVISKDCVLIGLGERTKPQAVEKLANELFKHNAVTKVIAIELPKKRAYMHLDTLMTMIDHDTFCVAFPCADDIRAWQVRPSDSNEQVVVEEIADVFGAIAKELGVNKLKLIHPGGDYFAREREQWTDASNLLAISPGKVIAYECNVNTLAKLKNKGIEVITIPGSELGRGRGGSRCMSCPVDRE